MFKYNYCTLFDSNYLTRGLAMYESLSRYAQNFHLYVFAFNDKCYELLKSMSLPNMTVISLGEFEDEQLLAVKPTRDRAEYCWTCTPSVIKYCLDHYDIDHCTYIDADVYFFSNPAILVDEMGDKSVLITEHRYTPKYDQSATSGIYCVQFMTFKQDDNGLKVLNWWREACLEWCYRRFEEGKFGDQKYLDDWTTKFSGVHVLEHLGGGVAPWNVQQYDMANLPFDLVFYHFHELKFLTETSFLLSNYELTKNVIKKVYQPYILHLIDIQKRLYALGETQSFHAIFPPNTLLDKIHLMRSKWRHRANLFTLHQLEDL